MINRQRVGFNERIRMARRYTSLLQGESRQDLSAYDFQFAPLRILDENIRICGYTLYGEDSAEQTNYDTLKRAMGAFISSMYSQCKPFALTVAINKRRLSVVVSLSHAVAKSIELINGTLADLKTERLNSIEDVMPVSEESAILMGVGIPSYGAIDTLISSNMHEDFSLCIIARPVNESTVIEEASCVRDMQSEFSMFQKTSLQSGNQTLERSINDVQKLLSCLEEHGNQIEDGRKYGLWKLTVLVQGKRNECQDIASSVYGFFSGVSKNHYLKRNQGTIILNRSVISNGNLVFPFYPHSEQDARNLGFLIDPLCDYVTSPELSDICLLPHQTYYGYRVIDGSGKREGKEPFSQISTPGDHDKSIVALGHSGASDFILGRHELSGHALIVGQSTFGKSTTVREILCSCKQKGIPFIIIESVKKEYRELLRFKGMEDVKVLSFGHDAWQMKINPFQPESGTMVEAHIGNIESALCSMSDMESPLPELLMACVRAAYKKYGWRMNERIDIYSRKQIPSIVDVREQIDKVLEEYKYDRSAGDIRAAIKVRIDRIGQLLEDEETSYTYEVNSVAQLMCGGTVIELDDLMGDTKSFIAGILLARIREFLKVSPITNKPGLILVLEEAHAIMPNEDKLSGKAAKAATDAFASMLSEMAAYGLSLFVIDQSPSRVNRNALINTRLKILHHIEYKDDLETIKIAAGMNELQTRALAALQVGEAIISIAGAEDPSPHRVQIGRNAKTNTDMCSACVICPEAGTDKCKGVCRIRECIREQDLVILEQRGVNAEVLRDIIRGISLRAHRKLSNAETTCIIGTILETRLKPNVPAIRICGIIEELLKANRR